MRAEKGGIIAASVEETFECCKTAGRNKVRLDIFGCGVVEVSNRLLGQRRMVWALSSFYLSSWGLFIHLEGGHHNIEQIRKLIYSRYSFVSVLTDKALFWNHCFYQCG